MQKPLICIDNQCDWKRNMVLASYFKREIKDRGFPFISAPQGWNLTSDEMDETAHKAETSDGAQAAAIVSFGDGVQNDIEGRRILEECRRDPNSPAPGGPTVIDCDDNRVCIVYGPDHWDGMLANRIWQRLFVKAKGGRFKAAPPEMDILIGGRSGIPILRIPKATACLISIVSVPKADWFEAAAQAIVEGIEDMAQDKKWLEEMYYTYHGKWPAAV